LKVVNRRNGAVLATSVERAISLRARLRGLIGRERLADGEALVIEPCTSIHTFFMRFSIDAAFVARDGRIVRAICALSPWRATRIYPSAALVIELPAGTLSRSGTREGDQLSFATPDPM
jgi:uncharacterized protein